MGYIRVHNLGKAYKEYPNRWLRLLEWFTPATKPRHSLKWILEDINFTIQPGEAVGIIGVNGAGKSTLLKLITGTAQCTTGSVETGGRVAALLELGMGFHPDFTGRENIYMAGQLLGMPTDEIQRLMPDIEAFAEINEYIDRPVRVFSSGMQVRLAFSVATAIRPDILIVDEALSVGDAYFQHKSFDRIRDFRRQGTTLLIVSHDKQAIQSICDRAILLNGGHLAMEGDPESVMDYYNALLAQHQPQSVRQHTDSTGKLQTSSGTGEARIESVSLVNDLKQPLDMVATGQKISLWINIKASSTIPDLVVGYVIKDRFGQPIFGTNTHHLQRPLPKLGPEDRLKINFTFFANLGEGSYSVAIALHTEDTHLSNNYEWRDRALVFSVINQGLAPFTGSAWLPPVTEYEV